MKRVLYNTSIADPFVQVAQKLFDEHGYEPVYWIGFDYDHSEEIVPKTFPNCVYQSYPDAWKGIFSKEIQEKAADSYLDVDMLNEFAPFELQAMTMMNRMDYDRYSFNFMERERHYLNLLKSWMAVLDFYKVDLVVSAVNPHRVYDYVLYLLCKKRGIRFICLQYSLCIGRVYVTDNIYSIGDTFDDDYQAFLREGELSASRLPDDIRQAFEKVQKNYNEAKPYYMNQHVVSNKRYNNVFSFVKKYLPRYSLSKLMKRRMSVPVTMRKNQKYSLEESKNSLTEFFSYRRKKISYNKMMNKYYSSLCTMPAEDERYILLPLHYQPEATTSPAGDIFVNQRLCIETILKNTPDNYYVYVKEHPQQFQNHMLGQTSRIKEFYSDILKSKRVRLMPLEVNSFELMKKAVAVATVTGTVGWEAVMHRLPVLVFGMIWFEKMPGVLRITDSNSAKKITQFLENYQFDEKKVLAYLMALAKNSKIVYHYNGEKEKVGIEEKECVDNLCSLILSTK